MKNKTLLPLLLTSAVLLAGCGKKKEEPAVAPAPQQQAPAASPTTTAEALDSAKKTAAEVGEQARAAGQQVVDQSKAAAVQVGEQAKVAAAQVKEKTLEVTASAAAQVKESAASVESQAKASLAAAKASLKAPAATATASTGAAASEPIDYTALATKVSESAKALLADPSVTAPLKEQLTKLADGVLGNQDGVAAAALNKIVALKPSDDQLAVVKEIQTNVGVLALGRNFDQNDPASGGAVKQTIDAIRAKDTASIVSGLQKIATTAKLTDAQKDIVSNLASSYGGKLSGVLDQVNKASSTLKSFGL